MQCIEEVQIDDAEGTAFATNPKAVRKMRTVSKVTSTDSVMVMESPRELAGFALASTTNVPSNLTDSSSPPVLDRSALIFGNWADLLIGTWGAFDLLVNPFESGPFSKGNVRVRGMLTTDIAVRHPESFAAAVNMPTT